MTCSQIKLNPPWCCIKLLQWVVVIDARADDPDFMDPILDRALDYLNQFDLSSGYFILLNRGPIKH